MGFSIFTKLLLPYLLLDLGSEVGVRCGKMYRSRHKMKPRWGWGSWGPFVIRSLSEEARTQVFFFFLIEALWHSGRQRSRVLLHPLERRKGGSLRDAKPCPRLHNLVLAGPSGLQPKLFPPGCPFSRVERLLWIPSHGMWAQIRKGSRKKCLAFKSVPRA